MRNEPGLRRSWQPRGLSLRAVQRIENTGACSLESSKALDAVFDIESAALEIDVLEIDKQIMIAAMANRKGMIYGHVGVLIGLISAYSATTYSVLANGMAIAEAGMVYGVTGACSGICAALIEIVANKNKKAS